MASSVDVSACVPLGSRSNILTTSATLKSNNRAHNLHIQFLRYSLTAFSLTLSTEPEPEPSRVAHIPLPLALSKAD